MRNNKKINAPDFPSRDEMNAGFTDRDGMEALWKCALGYDAQGDPLTIKYRKGSVEPS